VKQSDLGEYEENTRETRNIQYTRQSINSPSNQAILMANTNFQLKRAATKTQGFLMTKDNTPPEAKANHKLPLKPRQSNQMPNSTKDVDSP
jgi:hypothetical protein